MQDRTPFYPLKVISRTLPATRTNKLRLSWFALGAAAGIGSSTLFNPSSLPTQITAALTQPVPAIATPAVEVAATPAPQPETPANTSDNKAYPVALNLKIENGDTLINLLTDSGVSKDEAYNVWESIRKVYNPKKMDIGLSVAVNLDKNADSPKPIVKSLVLPISQISSIEVTRDNDDNFNVKKLDKPVERKLAHAGGRITDSLYQTGIDNGIPAALLSDIISAYSYDVDFQRDIKEGDAMDVLYERMVTSDGINAGHGNVIYAELQTGDRILKIYRYTDASGHSEYYTQKGESIRKALLRTPINGAKITSGFGMRTHPILGYSRMHRGVDFGAAIGTPIYAAGDGVVDFVGHKGGYGNYLRIRHNNTYSTAYGHISRFASGISPGTHVKQGEVVAYVGMTGMATGPHLHYEILVGNEQVNPANVKFKTGNVLGGKEMVAFRKSVEKVEAQLHNTPHGSDLAMADGIDKPLIQ